MKELIEQLEKKIQDSIKDGDNPDEIDWGYPIDKSQGVLISRSQAEMILNILKIYQGTK